MATGSATAAHTGGVAVLERALGYMLGNLQLASPAAMSYPTPCREWDVRDLLLHMNDALRALHDTIVIGQLALEPETDGAGRDDLDPSADPVGALRTLGCNLLGAWAQATSPRPVSICGRTLTSSVVAATGAVEVAVHGWDVARACGHDRPIPVALAEELLDLSSLIVSDADRGQRRFAPPVPVPSSAPAGDRLVAFLGRRP